MPNYEVEPCYVPVMERIARKEDGLNVADKDAPVIDLYDTDFLKDSYDARLSNLRRRLFPGKNLEVEEIPVEEETIEKLP